MHVEAGNQVQRVVVCLVVDDAAVDRTPASLRYLQIGLFDEQIDAVLIAPESGRARSFLSGPTTLMTYADARWPLRRWSSGNAATQIAQKVDALRGRAPAVVHCLGDSCELLAADLAVKLGARLVHTCWSAEAPPQRDAFDALIVPSRQIAAQLSQTRKADARVEVIAPGVPAAQAPAAFKDAPHSPVLVFAGPLLERAGIETLIRAAARLLAADPNLIVFLIGKGPGEPALRHLVQSLVLQGRIIFTGRMDYLRAALDAADVFCLPGAGFGFREEPLQAMAAGLAIVAAEDGPYDGLEHNQTCMLFPEGDETQLETTIRALLDDPAPARRLALAAQSLAKSQHAVGRMVAEHVRLYRRLASADHTYSLAPPQQPAMK